MEVGAVIDSGRYHGGLVFFGYDDSTLDRFARIVSASLEDYGHPVERQSFLNTHKARITASHYAVTLDLVNVSTDQEQRSRRSDVASGLNPTSLSNPEPLYRLRIDLCPADSASDDTDISELLMVVMLYRMVDVCEATGVEWLDPDTMLTLGQFLAAFTNAGPTRVRGRQEIMEIADSGFEPNGETDRRIFGSFEPISGQMPHQGEIGLVDLSAEESLAMAFRSEPHPDIVEPDTFVAEAQSDIRRLATWGMTGMMVFLSAPVAVSMAGVNLARGEDFRLNTHVLSLTGMLVTLESSGVLASAVSMLPL